MLCTLSVQAQLNTDRITAIGRNALFFDDYVLSIQYFNQVIKLKPYLSDPYLLRAIAKIQLGDYNGALLDCNQAIQLNPFQPGAYYTRGFVYRQLKDYDAADADFSEALIFSPDNKTYLVLRADVRAQNGHYDEAKQDIDYLLRREPHSPSLLFEQGSIALSSKDTLAALDAFSEVVKYDTQNPAGWSALGMVNLIMQREDEAFTALSKSISLGSKWAGDYINRGIIHYHRHNYRGALADYDRAIQIAPNDGQCYYNRAMLRQELGDYNRAIDDYTRAIELCPDRYDMYYQRAITLLQLRQWRDALSDLNIMMERYPYFLPSYYLAAQAKTSLGDSKGAYQLRYTASQLENKRDSITSATVPDTDVQVAKNQPDKRDRRKEFSTRTAQNQTDTNDDQQYTSEARGDVQHRHVDVVNEANVALTYYSRAQTLRRTNYTHVAIDRLNALRYLPASLNATTQEIPLTADMVNLHFEQITRLTQLIERRATTENCFARAVEFAMVQDYSSAIDDITQALRLLPSSRRTEEALMTFCRAVWRYRLIEYVRASGARQEDTAMDWDIMLRDYDHVLELLPDFSFALYNKANMLCSQKEYQAAIALYTRAIEIDADFAEAYFNRGLTRIYIDQVEQGIADLSKAGELGIYQAYNLITRFQ